MLVFFMFVDLKQTLRHSGKSSPNIQKWVPHSVYMFIAVHFLTVVLPQFAEKKQLLVFVLLVARDSIDAIVAIRALALGRALLRRPPCEKVECRYKYLLFESLAEGHLSLVCQR